MGVKQFLHHILSVVQQLIRNIEQAVAHHDGTAALDGPHLCHIGDPVLGQDVRQDRSLDISLLCQEAGIPGLCLPGRAAAVRAGI